MKRQIFSSRAFTLIELLIVVAIIAILAAIAVPNFLEAQVRSKVSRCKADMRSLATGLESYRVDTNRYPVGFPGIANQTLFPWGLWALSTPIAYVTNPFFKDPFIPDQATNIGTGSGGSFQALYPWDKAYQYSLRNRNSVGISGLSSSSGDQLGAWWLLRGFGPDQDADAYSTNVANNNVAAVINDVYDPTNGTVSNGNIYRVAGSNVNEAGRAMMSGQ